jgi:FkbH-like protein
VTGLDDAYPAFENRSARDLLAQARKLADDGDHSAAACLVGEASDATSEFPLWLNAARLLEKLDPENWARRTVRVAVTGSSTTTHLAWCLKVALARHFLDVEIYESPYAQYQQEILDAESPLYAFAPDVVVLAVDHREVRLRDLSTTPDEDLEAEVNRWTSLWGTLRQHTTAMILQPTFVPARYDALGNLGASLAGARRRQIRKMNLLLEERAPDGVFLVDAEMVAASVGMDVWQDDRYWYLSKHGVGLGAVPAFTRAIAAVMSSAMGLARKVVVLDLDNTLWGGVIGEDGLDGIELAGTPAGEAFQAFQEYLLALRRRGVLLAVVSKNNESDAREPFERHPDMRLSLEDFAAFHATWEEKEVQIRQISEDLSLGLDAFLFIDDNPVEREAVRRALPQVDVLQLPADATGYVAALGAYVGLETVAFTEEDSKRTAQYQARAQAASLQTTASSPEEFLRSLAMVASFEPIDSSNLVRVAQLLGKTNQFNVTTRRHSAGDVTTMLEQPRAVGLALRLRDRFTDHGLVGVLIAVPDGDDLRIDTWLMSCRVLGRGVEVTTMRVLADAARGLGFRRVVGEFLPSGRNAVAEKAFAKSGFTASDQGPERSRWLLDLETDGVPDPGIIHVEGAAGGPGPHAELMTTQ